MYMYMYVYVSMPLSLSNKAVSGIMYHALSKSNQTLHAQICENKEVSNLSQYDFHIQKYNQLGSYWSVFM